MFNHFGYPWISVIVCLDSDCSIMDTMKETKDERSILVGNSFPLTQVKSTVCIELMDNNELKNALEGAALYSFWGHKNSLTSASDFAGCDLTPARERPVLTLSERKRPVLDGVEFGVCWILSPVYSDDFRPGIGEEVKPEMITGWCIKRIRWE